MADPPRLKRGCRKAVKVQVFLAAPNLKKESKMDECEHEFFDAGNVYVCVHCQIVVIILGPLMRDEENFLSLALLF